jgi:hypothetical protein
LSFSCGRDAFAVHQRENTRDSPLFPNGVSGLNDRYCNLHWALTTHASALRTRYFAADTNGATSEISHARLSVESGNLDLTNQLIEQSLKWREAGIEEMHLVVKGSDVDHLLIKF